jgi:endonuclease/exonuclease/phosphatase family metal-dependent hydrolase
VTTPQHAAECFTETAPSLPLVPVAEREAILALPPDAGAHARVAAALPGLRSLERVAPPEPAPARSEARVVAWNAERGRFPEASAALLRGAGADVLLLSELDVGMARSGQRHTARELAARLEMGFVYGVEFLELGLGDAKERARCAGQRNAVGHHGGAIASALPLERPALVRLDAGGDWFDGRRGERRVGGRIAILATLRLGAAAVTLASVHLESHGDPAQRDAQIAALLLALERYAPGAPALLGGDVNTHSLGLRELEDHEALASALRADPGRLADPLRYEPLFERLAGAGFEREACNVAGASTERRRLAAGSERGTLRLDWLFTRGLAASRPEVVAALDPATGAPLSDHEAIAVTIRPASEAANRLRGGGPRLERPAGD